MCGRIVWVWDDATGKLVKKIDEGALDDAKIRHILEKERYNIPPSSHLPVFAWHEDHAKVEIVRWGFPIPARPNGVFNTRIETAAESSMWRGMFGKSHCVFPVKGFYEWNQKGTKRAHFIQRKDGQPMLLAGVLGRRDVQGESELCASIITCKPNALLARVHDRMPVILEVTDLTKWLAATGVEAALDLTVPAGDVLTMHVVSSEANSTQNDGPHLIKPIQRGLEGTE